MNEKSVLTQLEAVIRQRKAERPEDSYTTKLFNGGIDRILKKIGEEAGEIIIASKNANPDEIIYETADFLYHLLVMLAYHDIPWQDVENELQRRFGNRPH